MTESDRVPQSITVEEALNHIGGFGKFQLIASICLITFYSIGS